MNGDATVAANQDHPKLQPQEQSIILFYKYHPLSSDRETTDLYRSALEKLCRRLSLKGRILVGCSESEGLNGTLAGEHDNVRAFTRALLGETNDAMEEDAVREFRQESRSFFASIGRPVLTMDGPEDFKWSRCSGTGESLFPDLNVKLVRELIGTGGILSDISLAETAQGYLTPRQWHQELTNSSQDDDTVLIDCRNTKENEIGHFLGAIDPKTTTFAQFPKWVDDHRHLLENKRVLMYCTGGIRCEKASAYVRRAVPSVQTVRHLKGGIHKYLEELEGESESHWRGKNFVFHSHVETKLGCDNGTEKQKLDDKQDTVGRCIYCGDPYDQFDPHCVCTVCREPLLACQKCQPSLVEFHCRQHFHLRSCYFTDLKRFTSQELHGQLKDLETILIEIAIGKRFKQKRKTLHKQCDKLRQRLNECDDDDSSSIKDGVKKRCRNCEDAECTGICWGFHGLKRKEVLEQRRQAIEATKQAMNGVGPKVSTKKGEKKRRMKDMHRDRVRKELECLNLCLPASAYRDQASQIRVPPPCTRILQTKMKGKWKGKPVLLVVKEEFMELAKPGVLERVLGSCLLRVNGIPITNENAGVGLQTGDTISRIVHWHEPPVIVPEKLSIQKVPLPCIGASELDHNDDAVLYVCDKPSSVPVHPAGPYLANSLTMMAEAQEALPPQSLFPCHRTDRVTSGLTICCTSPKVASIVHRSMCEKYIQKLYIARVHGRFPASQSELQRVKASLQSELVDLSFSDETKCVRVDAPIETVNPAAGVREITENGKSASSLFRLLSYDPDSNLAVLCCRPLTGRSHQLRVHLQKLGHPIVGDVLYGGKQLLAEGTKLTGVAAVEALLQSTKNNEPELCGQSISSADASAAKETCALCQPLKGEDASFAANNYFTPAQLLEVGHSIDLHASRYRIDILPKNKSNEVLKCEVEAHGVLDLRVNNPKWAGIPETESLPWLDDRC